MRALSANRSLSLQITANEQEIPWKEIELKIFLLERKGVHDYGETLHSLNFQFKVYFYKEFLKF